MYGRPVFLAAVPIQIFYRFSHNFSSYILCISVCQKLFFSVGPTLHVQRTLATKGIIPHISHLRRSHTKLYAKYGLFYVCAMLFAHFFSLLPGCSWFLHFNRNAMVLRGLKILGYFKKTFVLVVFCLFSSVCCARSVQYWKNIWVSQAMSFDMSDPSSIEKKQNLLNDFEQQINRLSNWSKNRGMSLDELRNAGYKKKFFNRVYSESTLQDLGNFLGKLKGFLSTKMYHSWSEVLRQDYLYGKFAMHHDKNKRSMSFFKGCVIAILGYEVASLCGVVAVLAGV